jgi:hypothetical protein
LFLKEGERGVTIREGDSVSVIPAKHALIRALRSSKGSGAPVQEQLRRGVGPSSSGWVSDHELSHQRTIGDRSQKTEWVVDWT